LEPIEAEIKSLREKIIYLLAQKDAKIPYYEKLPKDHQFYKHLMNHHAFKRMDDVAQEKKDGDRMLFHGALEKLA
jgi:hypothetical protein